MLVLSKIHLPKSSPYLKCPPLIRTHCCGNGLLMIAWRRGTINVTGAIGAKGRRKSVLTGRNVFVFFSVSSRAIATTPMCLHPQLLGELPGRTLTTVHLLTHGLHHQGHRGKKISICSPKYQIWEVLHGVALSSYPILLKPQEFQLLRQSSP